jgi:kinesin family protein 13
MSVKVAVRVRPFNEREKNADSEVCIQVKGATTTIVHPATGQAKPYTFDYSFWSHDQFEINEEGYSAPDGPDSPYADQQVVYEALGAQVLEDAWAGYHCCLFAYGQTGSGKSYSMVGYGKNRGIVPIACDEIFKRIG